MALNKETKMNKEEEKRPLYIRQHPANIISAIE